MAPEVHDGHYSMSADIFSFGLLLYELTIGPNPFSRLGNVPINKQKNKRTKRNYKNKQRTNKQTKNETKIK